ncbi:hypothetical protein N7492_009830 [Penicillium capsulatum]|uniref:Rhodanese domain-containing protein n=1 Tax=Penicillium capsulatum TaxID=69766 RepID=A0A9W9HPL5_9EURO|nr:hypothetical protein N7492_009830 [Penicillium capsulatum]KAJ6114088.1 hypothetical protein N7512_007533 [Penicillium capsulatum]
MERLDSGHEGRPTKIIVVGGAAGGMSAALRARRLDEKASVTFIEQYGNTNFANSGVPSSVGGVLETDTFLIPQSPAALKARFNLDVLDHTELVKISKDQHSILVKRSKDQHSILVKRSKDQHSILVKRSDTDDSFVLPYDKLILAQGAYPLLPHVQGIDNENVFFFQTMLDVQRIKSFIHEKRCRSVVILGGGYLALKAMESLYHFGLRISIVHTEERIFEDFDNDFSHLMQSELIKSGVQLHQNIAIRRIALGIVDDCYVVTLANGLNVPADLIVVATGLASRIEIARDSGIKCKHGILVNEFMQTSDPDIYAVGDVAEARNVVSPSLNLAPLDGSANLQGHLAADHIMKRAIPYHGPTGVYSCKLPRLTAAIIGPSVEMLKRAGYYPLSVTAHTPDHPGYYPTSHQTTTRLAFQPSSGRLLSAQVLGRSGVERRIDVLSTALHARLSVFDLEMLELSYTTQYGSRRDPVNTVSMIASNLVRGDLHVATPHELGAHLHDWQIVDVRSPENFATCHVPTAVNVPIDTLRDNLAKFDKQHRIVVYSRVGYHGYLAYRTLIQSGYQVANLDGGLKLLIEGGYDIPLVSVSRDGGDKEDSALSTYGMTI